MDKTSIQELRYYLATPHVGRDVKELTALHWKATVIVDQLQQEIERLDPSLAPDTEPAEKTPRANKSAGTPQVDKQPPIL